MHGAIGVFWCRFGLGLLGAVWQEHSLDQHSIAFGFPSQRVAGCETQGDNRKRGGEVTGPSRTLLLPGSAFYGMLRAFCPIGEGSSRGCWALWRRAFLGRLSAGLDAAVPQLQGNDISWHGEHPALPA